MKCLTKDCKNDKKTRGICGKCYMAATNAVKSGLTSWEELVEMKLISVKERRSLFMKQLNEKTKSKQ